ncbi:MAG: hypothetical protein ACYTFG_11380, partial [Planctomycetota bacterium]
MTLEDKWKTSLGAVRSALADRNVENRDFLWARQKILLYLLRKYGSSPAGKRRLARTPVRASVARDSFSWPRSRPPSRDLAGRLESLRRIN